MKKKDIDQESQSPYSSSSRYKRQSESPRDNKKYYEDRGNSSSSSSSRYKRGEGRERDRSSKEYRNDKRNNNNNNRDNHKNNRDKKNQQYTWGGRRSPSPEKEEEEEKEEPNFGLSGKLAAETNTVNGVELKYVEPPEAAKPKQQWRLYVFKGSEQIELLYVHRQTAFLFGRDRVVVDIPIDHPSCSKQHAVLQYRQVYDKETNQRLVKPFIIDLESTNGTFINGEQIPATRYVELKIKDVITFGQSTREYVLLHSD
ncbi:unnamed protein product [Cunninghamella blakesleeana]